jgi:hypothetical protein
MSWIKRKIKEWLDIDDLELGLYNKTYELGQEIREINSKPSLNRTLCEKGGSHENHPISSKG